MPLVARDAGRPLRIVMAAVIAILATACGGSGSTGPPPTPVPSGVIAIVAREYQFTPSTMRAPAGAVAFSISNAGTQQHEFEIFKGDQVAGEVQGIAPGLTKDATVTLAAGDYTFVCKLNGHDQLGMKGLLTVTAN